MENILEKLQGDMDVIRNTIVKNINDKIMPFKAQKTLRQNNIQIGEIIKDITLAWAKSREEIMPNGYDKPSDIVNWQMALVEIIEKKISDLMTNEPDKVFALCQVLLGRDLDENSSEDGEAMVLAMNDFSAYIAEGVKKRLIEMQEISVGKSLMKLSETASVLSTLTGATNGLKNQQ